MSHWTDKPMDNPFYRDKVREHDEYLKDLKAKCGNCESWSKCHSSNKRVKPTDLCAVWRKP